MLLFGSIESELGCVSRFLAEFTSNVWTRLGFDANDKKTWTRERTRIIMKVVGEDNSVICGVSEGLTHAAALIPAAIGELNVQFPDSLVSSSYVNNFSVKMSC